MQVIMGLMILSLIYFVFSMHFHIIDSLKINKYGRGVFSLSSNKYRKSLKDTKEFQTSCPPVKEGECIYLPLRDVAKIAGANRIWKDNDNKLIIKFFGKVINVSNKDEVTVKMISNGHGWNVKNVKVNNNEILLPISTLKEMFSIKIEVKNENIIIH